MLTVCGAAPAQDAAATKELEQLYDRIVKAEGTIAEADALAALQKLADLNLKAGQIPPATAAKAAAIELFGTLATGNAQLATGQLAGLAKLGVDERVLQKARALTALASGDARLASAQLDAWAKADPSQAGAAERQKARLGLIGTKAPAAPITAEGGKKFAPDKGGEAVLLLDFWSTRNPPSKKVVVKALHELHKTYEKELAFELISINTDAAADLEKARGLANGNEYSWTQAYEKNAKGPLAQAYKLEAGGQVLIDRRGFIRAAGSLADAGFVYAVRAAVAEARGDYEYTSPTTPAGEKAVPSPAGGAAAATEDKKPDKQNPNASGELPSNLDARQKLQQAHAMRRGGKKTDAKRMYQEIVRDYPGTKEAQEAQEWLEQP